MYCGCGSRAVVRSMSAIATVDHHIFITIVMVILSFSIICHVEDNRICSGITERSRSLEWLNPETKRTCRYTGSNVNHDIYQVNKTYAHRLDMHRTVPVPCAECISIAGC